MKIVSLFMFLVSFLFLLGRRLGRALSLLSGIGIRIGRPRFSFAAWCSSSDLKENLSVVADLTLFIAVAVLESMVVRQLAVFKDTEDHGARAVCASVLGQVIRARELLAALVALEGLVLCMKGAIMALKVFLAAEATVAKFANKGLRWILGERLLASASVDRRLCWCSATRLGTACICVVVCVV